MQAALDALWMYTGEMFGVDATELRLDRRRHRRRCPRRCRRRGNRRSRAVLDEATLRCRPTLDAGRARARRQAGRAYRAPVATARRNADPAALVSGCAAGDERRRRRRRSIAAPATRATATHPGVAATWRALGTVLDPEIPFVSVVELGIVRNVERVDAPSASSPSRPPIRVVRRCALIEDDIRSASPTVTGHRPRARDRSRAGMDHRLDRAGGAPQASRSAASRRPMQRRQRSRNERVSRWRSIAPARRCACPRCGSADVASSRSSARPRARRNTGAPIASSRSTTSSRTDAAARERT